MKKSLLSALCLSVAITASAASAPKTTGDATWGNPTDGTQANITFNAIAIKTGTGIQPAKGSLIYTDANVTYTMDVQYLQVVNNRAYFVGQINSVTGSFGGCCQMNHWVMYEVVDNGEPGVGNDLVFGEDLTQSGHAAQYGIQNGVNLGEAAGAAYMVANKIDPMNGNIVISDGNIQVH